MLIRLPHVGSVFWTISRSIVVDKESRIWHSFNISVSEEVGPPVSMKISSQTTYQQIRMNVFRLRITCTASWNNSMGGSSKCMISHQILVVSLKVEVSSVIDLVAFRFRMSTKNVEYLGKIEQFDYFQRKKHHHNISNRPDLTQQSRGKFVTLFQFHMTGFTFAWSEKYLEIRLRTLRHDLPTP